MAANTLQERYSSLLDKRLRSLLVFKVGSTCNNRYEGSPKAGAVKIPVRPEAAVNSYSKEAGGTLNAAGTTYTTIMIDKDYYVNELIDGYDAAAVPDGLVADRIDSAAYSLAYTLQKDGIKELETTTTYGTTVGASTKDDAYIAVLDAFEKLSTNKVPVEGRVLLATPKFYTLLLQDPNFIRQGNLSQEMINEGAVGMVAGFKVFIINDANSKTEFLAYHPDWFTLIDEWNVPVHVQDLGGSGKFIGASAVQGRKIAKFKLTNVKACVMKKNA